MFAFIRAIYQRLVGTSSVVQNVYPRSADGAAALAITLTAAAVAWTWGNYAQIVAASASISQLSGFTLENFVGAASQGEIEIAIGGAGAEVAIGTFQATAAWRDIFGGAYIPAGTRIAARYRTSTGVADTVDIKINVVEGVPANV